jgi:hypothetical protein
VSKPFDITQHRPVKFIVIKGPADTGDNCFFAWTFMFGAVSVGFAYGRLW